MNNKIKNEILAILCYRVPNFVSETFIQRHLKQYPSDIIRAELQSLVLTQIVKQAEHPKEKKPLPYYCLAKTEGIPVRETIQIGDVEISRLLSDSMPQFFPETFNEAIEGLAVFSSNIESRFIKMLEGERRRYLANIAGILGVIVSVIAMVIVGLPKIQTDPCLPFFDVVLSNLAQLLPLSIAMSLLVFILWLVVRGKSHKQ